MDAGAAPHREMRHAGSELRDRRFVHNTVIAAGGGPGFGQLGVLRPLV